MSAGPEPSGRIGLRVPGAIAYRHLAIRLVSTACKMAIDAEAVDREVDGDGFEPEVVSAFGEAFNNVALHGHRGLAPGPVQIEVGWDEEKLTITMIDHGRTFDPKSVAPPDLDAMPESGMGLFIMTSCMDEVDYRPGPPNVLRLVKLRRPRDGMLPPAPAPDSGAGHAPPDAAPPASGRSLGPRSVSVVAAGPAEAGDRGSGVVERGGRSTWQRTAIVEGDRTGEGSRRK